MKKILYLLFFLMISVFTIAQSETSHFKAVNYDSIIMKSDIPVLMGQEVIVSPGDEYRNRREKRRHRKLVRNFLVVYPYAKLINKTLEEVENDLTKIPSEEMKTDYVKYREKKLRKKYEKKIKKLTISQGILLIKLIDRETGDTSYELLKDFKGKFLAATFQGIARLFGHNLKSHYDAEGEDKEIEMLIKKYENGQL